MAKEAKSRIEELIVNDNVLEAIEIFYAQEDHEEIVNRIILLKSNFNSLNRKIHAGVLSFEEETRALNKIKMELLDLVSMASIQPKSENSDKADQNFKFKEYSEDFGQLKMNVEKLTRDQYNVLRFLNKMNRVRISGCAGSGKTLVAIEKAIRLSQSGMSVIILCHNPFLSRKIRKLVKASTVFVSSFADFLKGIVDHGNLVQPLWNSYHEPTQEELNEALNVLEKKKIKFDAVIVDEAQDFREDWWIIIELMLAKSQDPILYIFHDDNQALLPYRSTYPFDEPIVDLSKNCRNGGKIYEFIKHNFHYQAPEVSLELKNLGAIKLFVYKDRFDIKTKVFTAIRWMRKELNIRKPVVLLGGEINPNSWETGMVSCEVPIGSGWKFEIINKLTQLTSNQDLINTITQKVSDKIIPSKEDERLISEIASQELEKSNKGYLLRKLGPRIADINHVQWIENNGKTKININNDDPEIMRYWLFKFLSGNDWSASLKVLDTIEFSLGRMDNEDTIPVFHTSAFKGMEADGVIVVTKGQSFAYLNELYVACSRAKFGLGIVIDKGNDSFLMP